jgi:KaiC/GvpD/RAD55 family RecA-like ATPase
VAVIAGAVVAFVYKPFMALVSGPSLGVFSSFADLIPGGIPDKYSLLLGSPACDERNLIMDQFLQSGAKKDLPLFVLTTDIDFARSTTKMFDGKLTALVANSRATAEKNLIPLPTGIQNLTTLNIELVKLVRSQPTANARLCLDVLSDIMLTHKLLTTRKWVTDLLPRLEEWGFTTMGVFNPSLHSNEEAQSLLGLFKGYVEVFEREISGKLRRLIAVRKMVDILYKENELVIDKGLLQNSLKR